MSNLFNSIQFPPMHLGWSFCTRGTSILVVDLTEAPRVCSKSREVHSLDHQLRLYGNFCRAVYEIHAGYLLMSNTRVIVINTEPVHPKVRTLRVFRDDECIFDNLRASIGKMSS